MRVPFTLSQPRLPDESFSKSVPQGTPQRFTLPYSLFSSHSPRPAAHRTPAFPIPLPGNARELLPAGALRSNVAGTYGSPTNAPSKNAVQGFVIGSACAAAFFHRGIIPLLTLFFSASGSQKTAVTPLEEGRQMPSGLPPPAGGSVPWRPPAVMRECKTPFPPHSPACRA